MLRHRHDQHTFTHRRIQRQYISRHFSSSDKRPPNDHQNDQYTTPTQHQLFDLSCHLSVSMDPETRRWPVDRSEIRVAIASILGALGVALGVPHVAVARALVLVAVGAGGDALALCAADVAVLEAPVHHPRLCAPRLALLPTVPWAGHDGLHESGAYEEGAQQDCKEQPPVHPSLNLLMACVLEEDEGGEEEEEDCYWWMN